MNLSVPFRTTAATNTDHVRCSFSLLTDENDNKNEAKESAKVGQVVVRVVSFKSSGTGNQADGLERIFDLIQSIKYGTRV